MMKKLPPKKITLTRFFVSRRFWINLVVAFVLVGIILFFLIRFLQIYTRHGKELVIPDLIGFTMPMIELAGYNDNYSFLVIDSIFDEDQLPGAVVMQNPILGTKVKKGRRIYMTIIASTQERVIMPDLRDLTLRQALNVLEMSKLKVGKLIYQPSFDQNAILAQFYQNDTISPGDTLVRGSVIDLAVGSGERRYMIPVPPLIGKTREEAIFELNRASFNLGAEFYLDTIPDGVMRVYLQEPMWDSDIPCYPGDSIHLWYRSAQAIDFDEYLKTFEMDSLSYEGENGDETIEF